MKAETLERIMNGRLERIDPLATQNWQYSIAFAPLICCIRAESRALSARLENVHSGAHPIEPEIPHAYPGFNSDHFLYMF